MHSKDPNITNGIFVHHGNSTMYGKEPDIMSTLLILNTMSWHLQFHYNYNKTFLFFTEFIEKLQSTYQALVSGTYRPGQIVIVPTLSRPTQQPTHAVPDAAQVNSGDGVEVHSFLEAILQISHTSNGSFRYSTCKTCLLIMVAFLKSVQEQRGFPNFC